MAFNFSRVICGRALGHQLLGARSTLYTTPLRSGSLRIIPAASIPKPDDFQSYNERIGRPMSPHLLIYKPELTAMLSISHRFAGTILGGYAVTLAFGALVLPHDYSYYISLIENLHISAPILVSAKFMLAFPFTYHAMNGIRHLFWDAGKFLKIKEVYTTGYIMVFMATILAAGLAVM